MNEMFSETEKINPQFTQRLLDILANNLSIGVFLEPDFANLRSCISTESLHLLRGLRGGVRISKEILAKLFVCKTKQITMNQEQVPSPDIICHHGDLKISRFPNSSGEIYFPKYVTGSIKLVDAVPIENSKLPDFIGGDVDFKEATLIRNVDFPDYTGGSISCDHSTLVENVNFPEELFRYISLGASAIKRVKFPRRMDGSLVCSKAVLIQDVEFPYEIIGNLYLGSLPSLKGLILPKTVTDTVYVSSKLTEKEFNELKTLYPYLKFERE